MVDFFNTGNSPFATQKSYFDVLDGDEDVVFKRNFLGTSRGIVVGWDQKFLSNREFCTDR